MLNSKFFCVCLDVYKIHEGYDYGKIDEILSTLNYKNLKIYKILIEKYKGMLENHDFEQDYLMVKNI